jgi:hypothetical protein
MSPGAEDLHSHRSRDSGPYSRYRISLALGAARSLRLVLIASLSTL